MGIPTFGILSSAVLVLPGSTITLDVFTSEPVTSVPEVKADNIRFATFQTQLGPQIYRYGYVVSSFDTGTFYVKGESVSTLTMATSVISGVYGLKFAGDPASPFGQFPFGYSYFGGGFPLAVITPPTLLDDPDNPFQFVIRRGYEGPQIIASWVNDLDLTFKLVRKLLDYPQDDTDGEAVYENNGSNYADLWVVDQRVYYYTLFGELDPVNNPSVFTAVGQAHVLAIDNQGFVGFSDRDPVLSATTTAQPGSPSADDRYLLPNVVTGGDWPTHEGEIAEYNGATWDFIVPKNLWTVLAQDTESVWVFRDGAWTEVMLKERLLLYDHLTEFERDGDQTTNFRKLVSQEDALLDGEKFNFDTDQGRSFPELWRFLKLFELPLGEAQGLIDYWKNLYNVAEVDIDFLTRIGAAIGYDDFEFLDNPLRRFLIANMYAIWPRVGSHSLVEEAMPMWLGTGITFTLKQYTSNVFVANESAVMVLNPVAAGIEAGDTLLDDTQRASHLEWDGLFHDRGLGVYLKQPFDALSWSPQGAVLSRTVDEPGGGTVGDKYIVPVGSVGATWAGHDKEVATWDGITPWIFSVPTDRHAYTVQDEASASVVWVEPADEWRAAIDPLRLLMLEWWLREYALPGSVYFRYLEDKT